MDSNSIPLTTFKEQEQEVTEFENTQEELDYYCKITPSKPPPKTETEDVINGIQKMGLSGKGIVPHGNKQTEQTDSVFMKKVDHPLAKESKMEASDSEDEQPPMKEPSQTGADNSEDDPVDINDLDEPKSSGKPKPKGKPQTIDNDSYYDNSPEKDSGKKKRQIESDDSDVDSVASEEPQKDVVDVTSDSEDVETLPQKKSEVTFKYLSDTYGLSEDEIKKVLGPIPRCKAGRKNNKCPNYATGRICEGESESYYWKYCFEHTCECGCKKRPENDDLCSDCVSKKLKLKVKEEFGINHGHYHRQTAIMNKENEIRKKQLELNLLLSAERLATKERLKRTIDETNTFSGMLNDMKTESPLKKVKVVTIPVASKPVPKKIIVAEKTVPKDPPTKSKN